METRIYTRILEEDIVMIMIHSSYYLRFGVSHGRFAVTDGDKRS
jgi:hypothetical protein